jgi:hypothetical protein
LSFSESWSSIPSFKKNVSIQSVTTLEGRFHQTKESGVRISALIGWLFLFLVLKTYPWMDLENSVLSPSFDVILWVVSRHCRVFSDWPLVCNFLGVV